MKHIPLIAFIALCASSAGCVLDADASIVPLTVRSLTRAANDGVFATRGQETGTHVRVPTGALLQSYSCTSRCDWIVFDVELVRQAPNVPIARAEAPSPPLRMRGEFSPSAACEGGWLSICEGEDCQTGLSPFVQAMDEPLHAGGRDYAISVDFEGGGDAQMVLAVAPDW